LAAAIAGAGDEAGAHHARFPIETGPLDPALSVVDFVVGNSGDEQVLPDGEPDVAVADIPGDRGEIAHLTGHHLADWQNDTDPVQPRLFLRVHADMSEPVVRMARLHMRRIEPRQLPAEFLLDRVEELLETPIVEHVFEPRLG